MILKIFNKLIKYQKKIENITILGESSNYYDLIKCIKKRGIQVNLACFDCEDVSPLVHLFRE